MEGRRCDRCKENKYDRQHGCLDCPACYNLVEDAVQNHRNKLNDLQRILKDIANSPTTTDDVDFESRLAEVQNSVDKLHRDAKSGAGSMCHFYLFFWVDLSVRKFTGLLYFILFYCR